LEGRRQVRRDLHVEQAGTEHFDQFDISAHGPGGLPYSALPGLWGDFMTDTRQTLIAGGLRVSRWSKCAVQEWV
jgi:hypothetical protein